MGNRKIAIIEFPMPRLGTVRKMETYKDGIPKPVTDELRKLHPLIAAASRRFAKERGELLRLANLYVKLCEDYSNGRDERFAGFLDKLLSAELPPDEN